MRSSRAAALATIVATALSFAPSSARADHDLGAEIIGETLLMMYLEVPIPDLRLEIYKDQPSLVLTMPLVFLLGEEQGTLATALIEPQFQTRDHAFRALLGTRLYTPAAHDNKTVSGFFEAAGVLGADGSGGAVGVGVSFFRLFFPCLSVGYRLVYAGGAIRHDVTLDIITALIPLKV